MQKVADEEKEKRDAEAAAAEWAKNFNKKALRLHAQSDETFMNQETHLQKFMNHEPNPFKAN